MGLGRGVLGCLAGACLLLLFSAAPALALEPIVISQFRSQGIGSTDFIQLKNISSGPATLASGWSIIEINNDDPLNEHSCVEVPNTAPAVTLGPGQDYLVGGGGTGTGAPDRALANASCGGGGTSAFPTVSGNFNLNASIGGDTVGFGSGISSEGTALSAPATGGQSDQRKSGGTQETDDNASDFQAVTANLVNQPSSAPAPLATTSAASSVLSSSATLNASVNPYDASVSSCTFRYEAGTAGSSYDVNASTAPCTVSGASTVTVSASASGLNPLTTYHYRIELATSAGTTDGSDQQFTTTAALSAPTVVTGAASGVGNATTTLNGSVNPLSVSVTDCHFEYGTTGPPYAYSVPCASTPSGSNAVLVSAFVNDISGLSPNTTYHFRLVASNANGTTDGLDQSFHTSAATADGDAVVISQFRSQGGTNFVQLKNISNSGVTLPSGWSLQNLNANDTLGCSVINNGPQVTLVAGQSYLITQAGWTGTGSAASDHSFNGSCSSLFGTGVLTLEGGTGASDVVGYGTLSQGAAGSGTPFTPVPSNGSAMQRLSNGNQDNGSDIDDFNVVTANPVGLAGGAPAPTGDTTAATSVGASSATLNGSVNPGGSGVSDCHFKYGTDSTLATSSTVPCSATPSGTGAVAVSAGVTGLSNSQQYYDQLIVTTGAGTLTGTILSFTTTAPNASPTGTTDAATAVGSNTVTLNATVNPHGASVTDCHFDYGTSMSYGSTVPCSTTPSGLNNVAVSAFVSGLAPNGGYHYRVDVTTANPPALVGGDQTFTTNALATPDGNKIVISQFRTQGVANGDYIELINTTSSLVSVGSGWAITNLRADDNAACGVITNGPAFGLGPGQTLLITQSGWTGTGVAGSNITFNGNCGSLYATGGVLELNGGTPATSDSVGYGALSNGAASSAEGTSTPFVPSDGTALQRLGSGTQDTGSNIDDFTDVPANPANYFATVPLPGATTSAPTAIGTTTATLAGTAFAYQALTPPVASCHFDWGTDTSYGHSAACASVPSGISTPESAAVTGLTADTTYHFRLVVTTSVGTTDSPDATFSTQGPPTGTNGSVSNLGATQVTVQATVNVHGVALTACGFLWGTVPGSHPNSILCSPAPSGSTDTPVSDTLTGLTPGTTYYYVVNVQTSGQPPFNGAEQQFTTNPAASESTAAPTAITATSATLNGTANPEGDPVSGCHFDFGTDATYGTSIPCASTPSGATPVPVSAAKSSLSPLTTYHYRLVVTTPGGTLSGADQQFTTLPPAPTGTTDAASGVGQTDATLNGTVNPHDGAVSDCHFDYGSSMTYGGTVACASTPSGSSPVGVSGSLTRLSASSTYHYRLVVTTPGGTLTGEDQTLTTSSPPSPTLPGAPTNVSAVAGNATAIVSFVPPVPNGSPPVTSYTVTASPGGQHASGAGSPIAVGGLSNGTRYTFTVTANNVNGSGPASTPSNGVTPTISPPVAVAPRLGSLSVSPQHLMPASTNLGSIAPTSPKGTGATVSYTDTEVATTLFTVSRIVSGHRNSRGVCVAGKPGHGKHPPPACAAHTVVGAFTHTDQPGANRFHFTGRVNGHALAAGGYSISAVAKSPAGKSSQPVTAAFTAR